MTYPLRIGLPLICVAVALAGCDRDEGSIRTYAAPKDTAPQAPTLVATADQPPPAPQEAINDAPLRWTLPAGWKQVGGSSEMRYATIDVAPGAQLTIVPLGTEAGALLPNIQRWAGQLGVDHVTDADLPRYTTPSQISGEQAQLVDITGPASADKPAMRLLGAIIPHDGKVWFVKLTAPDSVAAAQKSNFDAFVHSLQFAAAHSSDSLAGPPAPRPTAPAEQAAARQGRFRLAAWKTPKGWTEQPGTNAMRITSFRVGDGAQSAEVIISRIPESNAGSTLDNINRWRGQVGLEPVADPKQGDMQTVTVAGHEAILLSFTGTKSDSTKQLLVAIDLEGADSWFVKMLGPESVVSAQKDALRQFLASMQFVPETH